MTQLLISVALLVAAIMIDHAVWVADMRRTRPWLAPKSKPTKHKKD